jgi:hypothetical protein
MLRFRRRDLYTLTVVHDMLDDRHGPRYDLIDFGNHANRISAEEVDQAIQARWSRAQYWGIFILGGNLIIPYAQAANPMAPYGDTEPVWTDDLYGDLNGDWVPDTPVARLPDAGDLGLLSHQLIPGIGAAGGFALVSHSPTAVHPGSSTSLAPRHRRRVDAECASRRPDLLPSPIAQGHRTISVLPSDGSASYAFDGLQLEGRHVRASHAAAYCGWVSCHTPSGPFRPPS